MKSKTFTEKSYPNNASTYYKANNVITNSVLSILISPKICPYWANIFTTIQNMTLTLDATYNNYEMRLSNKNYSNNFRPINFPKFDKKVIYTPLLNYLNTYIRKRLFCGKKFAFTCIEKVAQNLKTT